MDPITDMFNKIKNAVAVGKSEVRVNSSKLKKEIALILKREGFLEDVKETMKGKIIKTLRLYPRYINDSPVFSDFKRISKPGQRIYKKAREIKAVKGGYGIAIISTSAGLMTDKEARRRKKGGEVLVEVW